MWFELLQTLTVVRMYPNVLDYMHILLLRFGADIKISQFFREKFLVVFYLVKFPIQLRFWVKLRRCTNEESGQAPKVILN